MDRFAGDFGDVFYCFCGDDMVFCLCDAENALDPGRGYEIGYLFLIGKPGGRSRPVLSFCRFEKNSSFRNIY